MGSDQTLTAEHVRNARIHVVAEVFQQVVGVTEAGPDDDFFAMGGHSLLVVEAIAALRRHHGLSVPARQFFEDASVRAVAAACVALPGPEQGPDGERDGASDGGPMVGEAGER